MGFGGITALGRTIGQAILRLRRSRSARSDFIAIVAGSAATMKYQYWRLSRS